MKRTLLVILGLLLAMSLSVAQASKPRSSMSVVMEISEKPAPDISVQLNVTLSSLRNMGLVTVELDLPEGVVLEAGEQSQTLELIGNKVESLQYSVKLPSLLAGDIRLSARAGNANSIREVAHDRIPLVSTSSKALPVGAVITPYSIRQREGQRLREYTLP